MNRDSLYGFPWDSLGIPRDSRGIPLSVDLSAGRKSKGFFLASEALLFHHETDGSARGEPQASKDSKAGMIGTLRIPKESLGNP